MIKYTIRCLYVKIKILNKKKIKNTLKKNLRFIWNAQNVKYICEMEKSYKNQKYMFLRNVIFMSMSVWMWKKISKRKNKQIFRNWIFVKKLFKFIEKNANRQR